MNIKILIRNISSLEDGIGETHITESDFALVVRAGQAHVPVLGGVERLARRVGLPLHGALKQRTSGFRRHIWCRGLLQAETADDK